MALEQMLPAAVLLADKMLVAAVCARAVDVIADLTAAVECSDSADGVNQVDWELDSS